MYRLLTPVVFALSCIISTAAPADGHLAKLEAAASGDHRSVANIQRNMYRHPVATLDFFGIRDDMTVVEISPGGGGWYTEVLAPYLRENGKLYAASFNPDSKIEYFRKNAQKFLDKLAARPDVYDRVIVTEFEIPDKPVLQPAGKADMVLTFRNTHNWIRGDTAEQTYQAMYDVLKPGGILGVVQHRGEAHMKGKDWAQKGYVPESEIIRMATEAGFKLVEKSDINANPKDTKDHPEGVWTLPPVYRLKDEDREKYQAIGESDRMTLKFVKP